MKNALDQEMFDPEEILEKASEQWSKEQICFMVNIVSGLEQPIAHPGLTEEERAKTQAENRAERLKVWSKLKLITEKIDNDDLVEIFVHADQDIASDLREILKGLEEMSTTGLREVIEDLGGKKLKKTMN